MVADTSAQTPQSDTDSRPTVTVLDYGAGNVRSAVRALEAAGADVILSKAEKDEIGRAHV